MFAFSVGSRLLVIFWLLLHCTYAEDNYDTSDVGDLVRPTIDAALEFSDTSQDTAASLDFPSGDENENLAGTQDGDEIHFETDYSDITDHTEDGDEPHTEEHKDGSEFRRIAGENEVNSTERPVAGDPLANGITTSVPDLTSFSGLTSAFSGLTSAFSGVTTALPSHKEELNTYFFYTKDNVTADPVRFSNCSTFCQEISSGGECIDDAICYFKSLVSLADPGRVSEDMKWLSTINTPDDVQQIVKIKGIKKLVELEKKLVDELAEVITRTYEQLIVNERKLDKAGNKSVECCTGICERFNEYKGLCELELDCFFKTFLRIVETDRNRHLLDLAHLPSYRNGYWFVNEFFRRLTLEKDRLDSFGNSVIAAYDKMVDIIRENVYHYNEYQHLLKYDQWGEAPQEVGSDIVASGSATCRAICAVADNNGDCRLDVACLKRETKYQST